MSERRASTDTGDQRTMNSDNRPGDPQRETLREGMKIMAPYIMWYARRYELGGLTSRSIEVDNKSGLPTIRYEFCRGRVIFNGAGGEADPQATVVFQDDSYRVEKTT